LARPYNLSGAASLQALDNAPALASSRTHSRIIIISHQLYDIFSVTDRLVIMRRGKKVAERNTKETTPDEVVGLITGSEEAARAGRAG